MRIIKIISTLGLVVSLALVTNCSGDDEQAEEAVSADAAKEEAAKAEAAKAEAAKAAAAAQEAPKPEAEETPEVATEVVEEEPAPAPAPVVAAPAPAPVPAPVPPALTGPQLGYNIGNFLLVKVDGANVRGGPGFEHRSVGKLKHGEKVTVAERRGTWVRFGEGKWVSQTVLTAYQKTFKVKAKTAEVRSAPNQRARIIEKLAEGAVVEVQGYDGKWAKIGNKKFVLRAQLGQSE